MGKCEGPCSQENNKKLGVRELMRRKIFIKNNVNHDESMKSTCQGSYTKEESCVTELCSKGMKGK